MMKEGQAPVALPRHQGKDYAPALRRLILKQAGLLNDEEE
jgi:hypothetical protein